MLTRVEVMHTIARDKEGYVRIAVQLFLYRRFRESVTGRMLANRTRLYGNTACIQALEDLYRRLVRRQTSDEQHVGAVSPATSQPPEPV